VFQEVPVLGGEDVCTDPIRVCGDECIGFLESYGFIFKAYLKRYGKILVNGRNDIDEFDEVLEFFGN